MSKRDLTARSILMLLPEARVIEIAKSLGVSESSLTFGAALSAVEIAGSCPKSVLEQLTKHELHFMCVRRGVVPDPACPSEQLIGYLVGEASLTCGAFYLTPGPERDGSSP